MGKSCGALKLQGGCDLQGRELDLLKRAKCPSPQHQRLCGRVRAISGKNLETNPERWLFNAQDGAEGGLGTRNPVDFVRNQQNSGSVPAWLSAGASASAGAGVGASAGAGTVASASASAGAGAGEGASERGSTSNPEPCSWTGLFVTLTLVPVRWRR